MPIPSGGCQTCRTRRIKCDETKPTCHRCSKSRRICLETSAAKQACFLIHNENRYASGKTKRPRGPRSSLTVLRPIFDLQMLALTYYLQYHLQTLTDVPHVSEGWSECVSAWNASSGKDPMVDLALSSMALRVYSRTQRHPPAAAEASSRYQFLLRLAQERISHVGNLKLNEQNIDACLLAVFLMGRYEGATYRPGDLNFKDSFLLLQSWSHHDGAMAILKVWNDNPSHNDATSIIKQTRRGLIKSCLLRNLPLPDWLLNGSRFGEYDLELEYDRILVRIVNLRAASAKFQQQNSLYLAKTEELSNTAEDLDNALQDWATQITSTCSYQQHVLTEFDSWPRRHFYSPIVYNHSSPGHAAVWSQYFATRMLINNTRLRILNLRRPNPLLDSTYDPKRLECIAQMTAMADSLASTIPYCLERFKADNPSSPLRQSSITLITDEEIRPHLATLVVWPLTIASSLEGIDVQQQLWFKSELASLGRIIGDGVLECADTDQWAAL